MKEEMFEELVASVREGGAILRGKKAPSRTFTVEGPDVKSMTPERTEHAPKDSGTSSGAYPLETGQALSFTPKG